jgi:peptidoglycan/xylan/chitin deacetylase (PgdA/CDA1 family)
MKIIPPFNFIDNDVITKYLLENNIEMKFSGKQKLYYNYLRKFIPLKTRKRIQEKYYSDIKCKKDFIYSEFVELVRNNIPDNKVFENLYPENKKYSLVITHDVEEKEGFDFIPRILELEKKYNFKSSWNIVPYKYKIDEGIINLIRDAGCEVGIHGYNHDGKLYFSEKIFNKRAKLINEAIKKFNAVGFRSPMVHRNLRWLQKLDIKYDSSCFDYDPYQPFPGGTGSIWPFIVGKFVELPYTLPQDHTLFYVLKQNDISIWKNKIEWIIKNNGMILLLTHPDYLIENKHFKIYEDLLIYLSSLNNFWGCLPKEMSEYWFLKFQNLIN